MNKSTTSRLLIAASLLGTTLLSAFAQAPAAPATPAAAAPGAAAPAAGAGAAPAGRAGGRGAGPVGPADSPFTAGQIVSYAKAMDIPADLNTKVTQARTALTTSALKLPVNSQDIQAKAAAVAAADLALATERATAFAKVSGSLTPSQRTWIAQGGNPIAGGNNAAPGGTMPYEDYTGFTKIWDGETFKNWDGETDIWSIEDGAIHNDNSPGHNSGQHHIVYTGPGNILKDFDFKVEMKMTNGANGGIQYRSRRLSGHGDGRAIFDPATMADPFGKPLPAGVTTVAAATAAGITGGNPWQVSGYQFDMNSANNYTGQLYEGQGRNIITLPGEIVQLFPGGVKMVIGHVADNAPQYVKPVGEWNQLEVIARGYTLVHMMNGHVMSMTIDDDPVRRASSGLLSLQLEGNGAIWYRNVYLKHL